MRALCTVMVTLVSIPHGSPIAAQQGFPFELNEVSLYHTARTCQVPLGMIHMGIAR